MTVDDVEKKLEAFWSALVAEVHSLFHKDQETAHSPAQAANVQDIARPSPVPETPAPTVVVNPDDSRTAPGNAVLDGYLHSNPQYVPPNTSVAPPVDTSAAELDFAKVGGGVPIPLPKTIKGCPAKVTVRVFTTVNTTPGTDKYVVTVNGISAEVPNAQNVYLKTDVDGPTVSVSTDVAGMAMEIHGA